MAKIGPIAGAFLNTILYKFKPRLHTVFVPKLTETMRLIQYCASYHFTITFRYQKFLIPNYHYRTTSKSSRFEITSTNLLRAFESITITENSKLSLLRLIWSRQDEMLGKIFQNLEVNVKQYSPNNASSFFA